MMSNQNGQRLPISAAAFEDSPIEKMVKRAISDIKTNENHESGFLRSQSQREALRPYESTALFKQLVEPVVKQPVVGASPAETPASAPTQPIRRETFGHLLNCSANEVDSNTWKTKLPNAGTENTFSKPSPARKQPEKRDSEKAGAKAKRQYTKKPRLEKPVKGKGVKPVKTTSEIIQEFNFARASEQNGMGNFELGYMNDLETMSVFPQDSLHLFTPLDAIDVLEIPASKLQTNQLSSKLSNFTGSPDKSSNHSLYPEEEIPPQAQSQRQQILVLTPEKFPPYKVQQQEKYYEVSRMVQQKSSTSRVNPAVLPQIKPSLDSDGLQNESQASLRELNRKLLREVAILRLFIRSQKARIDDLCKQNEAYRQMMQQNAFQKHLESIEKMFNVNEKDPSGASAVPSATAVMVWGS